MGEYMRGRDKGALLVVPATAASNIVAGTMVGIITGVAANTEQVYSLAADVTGFSCTALKGYHFMGVLDDNVSAGECPIAIWTEGVFEFTIDGDSNSGLGFAGLPVYASTGGAGVQVSTTGNTGDMAIGTLVREPLAKAAGAGVTGTTALVKINPGAWRWSISLPSNTASSVKCLSWPPLLQ